MKEVLYVAYDMKDNEQVRFIGTSKEIMKEFGIQTKDCFYTTVSLGKCVKARYLIKSFVTKKDI